VEGKSGTQGIFVVLAVFMLAWNQTAKLSKTSKGTKSGRLFIGIAASSPETAKPAPGEEELNSGDTMKTRIALTLLLGIAASMPAHAARTILYYQDECCRNITEGEFAILYAQGLRLREPAQGWTVQSAAAALSTLGHQPGGGWVLSRFLSEKVMARLLQNSPFYRNPFDTRDFQRSDKLVTISKARSVFPSDEGLTQGEFAVLLAQALELPAPSAGWTPENAATALMAQQVPIRPAAGWKINGILREWEMLQILAPTRFRSTPIDANAGIGALQAYSILFGEFEIATEGDFGLFVVQALGFQAPPGGWSKQKALEFLAGEFGITSGYGWNADVPLCAEVFESALRRIMNRSQQKPAGPETRRTSVKDTAAGTAGFASAQRPAGGDPAEQSSREFDEFIREVRRSGLIPTDRCAIIPAEGLLPLAPLGPRLPEEQPSATGRSVPPASSSVPPRP
jgi:hypothetical protein